MPELPEVQALADFLRARTAGLAVVGVEIGSITVLKTFSPPPDALIGAPIDGGARFGKFIDLDCGGTHLVFHLARAGWLRWSDALSSTVIRPGKSPIALRVRLDDGSGFDLTEAGTKKRLAAYIVGSPEQVPGIATLGPDPLGAAFTEPQFAAILAGRRAQIKGVLRDQGTIAGIGNAYSDEILHVAKMSPFAIASSLDPATVTRLYAATRETLTAAVAAAPGEAAAGGERAQRGGGGGPGGPAPTCPECGDVVREVSFADSSLQYCATCQTGGKPLADRRTSKFLK